MQAVAISSAQRQGPKADEEKVTRLCRPVEAAVRCAFLVSLNDQRGADQTVESREKDYAESGYVLSYYVLHGGSGSIEYTAARITGEGAH